MFLPCFTMLNTYKTQQFLPVEQSPKLIPVVKIGTNQTLFTSLINKVIA